MSLGAGAYKVGRARQCFSMREVSMATLQVPPPPPPPHTHTHTQAFTSIGGGASMEPPTPTLIINMFVVVSSTTHYGSSKAWKGVFIPTYFSLNKTYILPFVVDF